MRYQGTPWNLAGTILENRKVKELQDCKVRMQVCFAHNVVEMLQRHKTAIWE